MYLHAYVRREFEFKTVGDAQIDARGQFFEKVMKSVEMALMLWIDHCFVIPMGADSLVTEPP